MWHWHLPPPGWRFDEFQFWERNLSQRHPWFNLFHLYAWTMSIPSSSNITNLRKTVLSLSLKQQRKLLLSIQRYSKQLTKKQLLLGATLRPFPTSSNCWVLPTNPSSYVPVTWRRLVHGSRRIGPLFNLLPWVVSLGRMISSIFIFLNWWYRK